MEVIERSSPWNSPDRVGGSGSGSGSDSDSDDNNNNNNNSLKGVWWLSALHSDDVGGGMLCWAAAGNNPSAPPQRRKGSVTRISQLPSSFLRTSEPPHFSPTAVRRIRR
jgi:hypothetical protein